MHAICRCHDLIIPRLQIVSSFRLRYMGWSKSFQPATSPPKVPERRGGERQRRQRPSGTQSPRCAAYPRTRQPVQATTKPVCYHPASHPASAVVWDRCELRRLTQQRCASFLVPWGRQSRPWSPRTAPPAVPRLAPRRATQKSGLSGDAPAVYILVLKKRLSSSGPQGSCGCTTQNGAARLKARLVCIHLNQCKARGLLLQPQEVKAQHLGLFAGRLRVCQRRRSARASARAHAVGAAVCLAPVGMWERT